MREGMGKFRGLAIDGSGWKYGFLIATKTEAVIIPLDAFLYTEKGKEEDLRVMKWQHVGQDTIGQYTGLKDRKGKEIFEGDRAKRISGEYIVVWHRDGWALFNGSNHISVEPDIREVIGTIHDKQESSDCCADALCGICGRAYEDCICATKEGGYRR